MVTHTPRKRITGRVVRELNLTFNFMRILFIGRHALATVLSDAIFCFMNSICIFCLTFFTSIIFSLLTEQKISETEMTEKQGAVL